MLVPFFESGEVVRPGDLTRLPESDKTVCQSCSLSERSKWE